jgi:hypothetical protein
MQHRKQPARVPHSLLHPKHRLPTTASSIPVSLVARLLALGADARLVFASGGVHQDERVHGLRHGEVSAREQVLWDDGKDVAELERRDAEGVYEVGKYLGVGFEGNSAELVSGVWRRRHGSYKQGAKFWSESR